ncbi:hypothetical protein DCC85_02110 [Paenibacillus sp. CAA11]|uniref:WXG100 family type VII secretion target n=1 Tax=Paenibacillus sp. CAA11 TaxID=1532905 RepID=UPI000D3927E5|nr:WXG100 family type VII secretion target [Paenibacillus sp. CAA11]AWB43144.1 hypothetical protein DCC85_02110 [Paenibacillus sp. CAA11]
MGNQSFSPEQARSVSKSISSKGKNVETLINQLDNEIKAVSGWWQGESSVAFVEEFHQLKENYLKKMVECVEGISKQLNSVADVKEQSERDIAAQLRR